MLLIKILNNSGPSIDPWQTALSTVFHLAIEPLTKFSYMDTSLIPYPPKSAFISPMSFQSSGKNVTGLTEAQVDGKANELSQSVRLNWKD